MFLSSGYYTGSVKITDYKLNIIFSQFHVTGYFARGCTRNYSHRYGD